MTDVSAVYARFLSLAESPEVRALDPGLYDWIRAHRDTILPMLQRALAAHRKRALLGDSIRIELPQGTVTAHPRSRGDENGPWYIEALIGGAGRQGVHRHLSVPFPSRAAAAAQLRHITEEQALALLHAEEDIERNRERQDRGLSPRDVEHLRALEAARDFMARQLFDPPSQAPRPAWFDPADPWMVLVQQWYDTHNTTNDPSRDAFYAVADVLKMLGLPPGDAHSILGPGVTPRQAYDRGRVLDYAYKALASAETAYGRPTVSWRPAYDYSSITPPVTEFLGRVGEWWETARKRVRKQIGQAWVTQLADVWRGRDVRQDLGLRGLAERVLDDADQRCALGEKRIAEGMQPVEAAWQRVVQTWRALRVVEDQLYSNTPPSAHEAWRARAGVVPLDRLLPPERIRADAMARMNEDIGAPLFGDRELQIQHLFDALLNGTSYVGPHANDLEAFRQALVESHAVRASAPVTTPCKPKRASTTWRVPEMYQIPDGVRADRFWASNGQAAVRDDWGPRPAWRVPGRGKAGPAFFAEAPGATIWGDRRGLVQPAIADPREYVLTDEVVPESNYFVRALVPVDGRGDPVWIQDQYAPLLADTGRIIQQRKHPLSPVVGMSDPSQGPSEPVALVMPVRKA